MSSNSREIRPSPLLTRELPDDPVARLEILRSHAGGSLPLLDHYLAGSRREVWKELQALGSRVREEPHAADALAVAFETMQRVRANIETVASRLASMKYRFENGDGRPRPASGKIILEAEKRVGPIPLSLRTFYQVVGEVDWMGHHPALTPDDGKTCPDPLVVYPLEAALDDLEDRDGHERDSLVIAPDDLHKADISGGEPYEVGVPDPAADGKLLNESHDLYFVDYLRRVFDRGGFPGLVDPPPALRAGLIPF